MRFTQEVSLASILFRVYNTPMNTKILILSDSHGRVGKLKDIIISNIPNIIIYLGDGEKDLETVLADLHIDVCGEDPKILQVKGNCDRDSYEEVTLIRPINGIRFYITHGYEQGVKYGTDKIAERAALEDCKIVLFGHTHRPLKEKKNGLLLFNPGSVANGEYGIITLSEDRVTASNRVLPKKVVPGKHTGSK